MKVQIDFRWFEGVYRPFVENFGESAEEFVAWLNDDVQYCLHTTDELINITANLLDSVNNNIYDDYGNAHHLTIKKDYVLIENDYSNLQVLMTSRNFIDALSKYKEFLQSNYSSFESCPKPFEIIIKT